MKVLLLVTAALISCLTYGQRSRRDTLVFECSPVMADLHSGLAYSIQGKIVGRIGKYLSFSAKHNHSIYDIWGYKEHPSSPDPYKMTSLSEFNFGLMLLGKGLYPESRFNAPGLGIKRYTHETYVDAGLSYYRFAAYRQEFYSYDTLPTSERQVISSISRLSVSFGLSHVIRKFVDSKLLRQHSFSAGLYHGINYYLTGYADIEGQNPSTNPPKTYGFRKDGYYLRYNFQQQLNRHLYVGCELSFHRLPYVQYQPNLALFVWRGGEREWPFQPYAGLTIGWRI